MITDSAAIAKQCACSRTKCTAIVKEALAPYYNDKIVSSMSNPLLKLMDESNDKTDKSCIILIKVYSTVGDVHTRFLDLH